MKSYYCSKCREYHFNRSKNYKKHLKYEREPPVLAIGEIFGIFFIVLIIQISFMLFNEKDIWSYLGPIALSSSSSALIWMAISGLFRKRPDYQNILIDKKGWFIPIIFVVFILSLIILFQVSGWFDFVSFIKFILSSIYDP